MKPVDAATRKWIRNKSDEIAVSNGCRFDAKRGQFVVDWIEKYCCLYEGEYAGQQMKLKDWQYEAVMRIFGWVKYSEDWKRTIRRFRKATIFVPKKNAKTPTIAAIGLYLLIGDGEQGQKVFTCARDGKQAALAQTHAVEMVRRSPELARACTINKSTQRITHEESRSAMTIVSGDNIEGQEGLNGSMVIDELHVVDARLMKVLKYAGASRSEPLHLEVTTAGNNPDSYGKARCDHGHQVAAGEIVEEDFFFLHYGAPENVTDAELDADPVKYGKMSNPTWGRLIREVEFLSAYGAAKKSISDLADFKMYRLNIWQHASNPWLRASDWAQCKSEIRESDLEGKECVGGLDLSRVSDMTALALSFDHPTELDAIAIITKFWIPEHYAKLNNHLAPFLEWAKDRWLTLTPGSVMDYGFLKADIRALAKRFKIQKLLYDEMYAEEVTQTLVDGTTDNTGKSLEEGIGCERIAFKQNLMTFAKPTEDFEALVIGHKLAHLNNPVMNWMAGHCEVYRDANGNKRPIKPDGKRGGHKKIDGIVAGIMSLAGREADDGVSSYSGKIMVLG